MVHIHDFNNGTIMVSLECKVHMKLFYKRSQASYFKRNLHNNNIQISSNHNRKLCIDFFQ